MKRWPTKSLGEVCELVNGAAFKPSDWDGSGLPIVRIQNLNDSTKPFNYTSRKIAEKFRVRPGDTLLSWSGTPGTSFGCFRWGGPEGWLNQHIFNVHLNVQMLPPFFIHQVNSKLDELIGKAHGGVGLQHITKGALSSVNMTVPPLEEQERLVKLLDEADELRKLRAQADRRTENLIPALFHEMFGEPRENTGKYQVVSLESLCDKISDGTHKTPTYIASGVPFVTVKNIVTGQLDFSETKFISEQEHSELTKRTKPERGDILVSKDGTIGVPCPVDTDRDFSIFVSVALLKPKKELVDQNFLVGQLTTGWVQSQIREGTKGIAIKHLHLKDFKTLKLVLPPLALQKEFAQRVGEIRELETSQSTSRSGLDNLFQSMLHRAFNGEL
jgi:type I restriction enzyme S subunit